MTKISFCHFFDFLFLHVSPINLAILGLLNFLGDFLSHLDSFQLLVELFEDNFPHLQIINTAMGESAVFLETSDTKLTWNFSQRFKFCDKFDMFG
jgi:hypothetical protein